MQNQEQTLKKLLYKLEENYSYDLTLFFDEDTQKNFKEEVTKDRVFHDREGFPVLTITSSCQLIVHKGYRWDGCSPKVNIFNLFWIGIPDGIVIGSGRQVLNSEEQNSPITNERITHLASAVHDVLGYCKWDTKMPDIFRGYGERDLWFSPGRNARDRLFLEILKQKKFTLLRYIYYWATVIFGPIHSLLAGQSSVDKETTES